MASLSIVWITDAMLNIFLYIANEKCENMSSHSEKYPSSFNHHVPQLEKQSEGLCISFYFQLYPSTSSIPVELSSYTLTLFSENVAFINFSSVSQWLRLGNPDSSSHVCVAVTWWVTSKFLCHQICHQFIFYPQEMLQTPTSIWVLPKNLALSLYHPTLPLSSASNQPDCVGSHRCASSSLVLVCASPLYLLYISLSFRQLHIYHFHQKAGSIDTKLAVPSECSLCHLLYLSLYL